MSISPVTAHSGRGADLVALFGTYESGQQQRDSHAAASAAAPAPSTGPPTAALHHPTRRPAFLAAGTPARTGQAKRQPARDEHSELSGQPGWPERAPHRHGFDAIPGNNRLERPIQPDAVHSRRIGPEHDGHSVAAREPHAVVSQITGAVGMLARKAILERARCLAPWARAPSAMQLAAA